MGNAATTPESSEKAQLQKKAEELALVGRTKLQALLAGDPTNTFLIEQLRSINGLYTQVTDMEKGTVATSDAQMPHALKGVTSELSQRVAAIEAIVVNQGKEAGHGVTFQVKSMGSVKGESGVKTEPSSSENQGNPADESVQNNDHKAVVKQIETEASGEMEVRGPSEEMLSERDEILAEAKKTNPAAGESTQLCAASPGINVMKITSAPQTETPAIAAEPACHGFDKEAQALFAAKAPVHSDMMEPRIVPLVPQKDQGNEGIIRKFRPAA